MAISGRFRVPRREERFKVRVPVTIKHGGKEHHLFTGDVSFRGLFICTDTPPVLRQLISISLKLPPDGTPFDSHGMSVYVLSPTAATGEGMPGVGVQFYAQGDSDRRKWERFVTHIKLAGAELPEEAVDPIRRRHPRVDARFEVRPKNLDELETIFSRDVSQGGIFLDTDMTPDVGARLVLAIFHPISRQTFQIAGVVRRLSTAPPGVGVEFTDMDSTRQTAFAEFIKDGVRALKELDEVVVEA